MKENYRKNDEKDRRMIKRQVLILIAKYVDDTIIVDNQKQEVSVTKMDICNSNKLFEVLKF